MFQSHKENICTFYCCILYFHLKVCREGRQDSKVKVILQERNSSQAQDALLGSSHEQKEKLSAKYEQQWEEDAKSLDSKKASQIAWEQSCFHAARGGI